jgi:hypothetical protein
VPVKEAVSEEAKPDAADLFSVIRRLQESVDSASVSHLRSMSISDDVRSPCGKCG